MNGFGLAFHALIHLRMSASSPVTLRCAERRSFFVGQLGEPPLRRD